MCMSYRLQEVVEMERSKAPKAVLTGAEWEDLAELQGFVQTAAEADLGAVRSTARIDTSTNASISGKFTTMRIDDPSTQISTSFRFESRDAVLLVFQAIMSAPTLTDLSIVFGSIVEEAFAVVGASRTLSTLDITCTDDSDHVKAINRVFFGNSVLRSCTLRLHPCDGRRHPLWAILSVPFTTTVESEANVGLRELVLLSTEEDDGCWLCQEAIAALVTRNRTLEKLEVGDHIFPNRGISHFDRVGIMARAAGCNSTLKEIRFQCCVAELKDLLLRLVPDADGRQANTTLSTLKLSLTHGGSVLDCIIELAELVESNTTLKYVQVSQDGWSLPKPVVPHSWWGKQRKIEKQNRERIQGVMALEFRLRGELERMRNNELQRNASLESLRVGLWQLLRVGGGREWQMTYEGPCLEPRTEYVVEVKMSGGVEHLEQPSWTSVSAYSTPSRTVYNTTARPYSTKPPAASSAAHSSTSHDHATGYLLYAMTDGGGDGGGGGGD